MSTEKTILICLLTWIVFGGFMMVTAGYDWYQKIPNKPPPHRIAIYEDALYDPNTHDDRPSISVILPTSPYKITKVYVNDDNGRTVVQYEADRPDNRTAFEKWMKP